MTTVDLDIFTEALTDADRFPHPLMVERLGGHRSTTDLAWWLRTPGVAPPDDNCLLEWITSGDTVIDVGCATGRQLEQLSSRGVTATGVDTCAEAVHIAQRAGLDAVCADARLWTPGAPATVVLALGGGAGICGTHAEFDAWLEHMASWLTSDGRLILTSVDWRNHGTTPTTHTGRYGGEVQLRLRYRSLTGGWFPWLWIDPDLLLERAARLGFQAARTAAWGAKYGIEFERKEQP